MKLTELQFTILDGMADDYEDVEQLYLYANREFEQEEQANIEFPLMLVRVRFHLCQIVDELSNLMRAGFVEAKYSNDERIAPLQSLDSAALHHYWFGATPKGMEAWKAQYDDFTGHHCG